MEIYLRALQTEDYVISCKWRNDRMVTDNLGGNTYYVSPENELNWIKNAIANDRINLHLAICIKNNDLYIGNVNLTNIDYLNRSAEFSIFIGEKKYHGHGIATKASKEIIKFGFKERNLNRIYLTVLEENKKAQGLYHKLGFKIEGVLRDSVYKNGAYHNLVQMSILKKEYDDKI